VTITPNQALFYGNPATVFLDYAPPAVGQSPPGPIVRPHFLFYGNPAVTVIDFSIPAIGPSPPYPIPVGDVLEYLFQFPDQGSALQDPIIGPVMVSPPAGVLVAFDILVYPNVEAQSVTPLPGYWVMISQSGGLQNQYFNHPDLQMINDRTLLLAGQPSVVLNSIPIAHINLTVSNYGVYILDGLQKRIVPGGF
jgi:hypothetical protein